MSIPKEIGLYELLIRSADAALPFQRSDGSLPPGHNGPHNDPETPVRNTGHWLLTWAFSWKVSGEQKFYEAAQRAASYLMQDELRPGGYSYEHRRRVGKDRCNGLMGPAFSIETLAEGGNYLKRDDMLELASHLVKHHPFDEKRNLWRVREIDGKIKDFDWTLNHQIWFAAAVSFLNLAGVSTHQAEVGAFLAGLRNTMLLHENGKIQHIAQNNSPLQRFKRELSSRIARQDLAERKRETAYHCFNLYALALLKRHAPAAAGWQNPKIRAAIEYSNSKSYRDEIDRPEFVRPYIPAGFPLSFAERAFVNQVFGIADINLQKELLTTQVVRTFDWSSNFLSKNSIDPVTQSARMYEMTRLEDRIFTVCERDMAGEGV